MTWEIANLSNEEKLGVVLRRSLPLLPSHLRAHVAQMIHPKSLGIIAGVTAVWAASHFVGVGAIVDAAMLLIGITALGGAAFEVARDLYRFAKLVHGAESDAELDEAAELFAKVVSSGGITLVMTLLMRRRPRQVFKGPTASPARAWGRGRIPWRYRPSIAKASDLPAGSGFTNMFGDIVVSSQGTSNTRRLVLIHEKVHAALTPKLRILRNLRVSLRSNGYAKSHLLRYAEEALAESVAQAAVNGPGAILEGLRFPVKNGYVTLSAMANEIKGIFMGPITVGGVTYRTYMTPCETDAPPAGSDDDEAF